MILPETEQLTRRARATHTVDILAFVGVQDIPALYFDTPYRLSPAPGGEMDYALLHETLRRTRKIGIAHVVIRSRRHLAVLATQGQSLVLNMLRWEGESVPDGRFGLREEEALLAEELAMMEIPARAIGGDCAMPEGAGNHPEILIQELEGLREEEWYDDEELPVLPAATHHAPDSHAMRRRREAGRPPSRARRSRMRRN